MFKLRHKRSGGMAVTAAVHRLVARGNQARDRRDWDGAADAYDQALRAAPDLAHIWVQYGHASKERGRPDTARAAYERASALRPADPDPLLHLGHLANMLGDQRTAGRHYLACFRADPGHADAAMALHRAIATARGRTRDELIAVMRTTLGDQADAVEATVAPGSQDTLVFDVSDLILFYAHGRLPTGIQRVQIQTITNAVGAGWDIRLCCFIDGRDEWLGVPQTPFLEVVALSQRGGDRMEPAWIAALHRLHLRLALAPGFVFPRGSTLVNLGSSWQLANYFLFVRAAKAASGIRYVPFVHDLIPIVAPQHFVRGAKREVAAWLLGIFTHADHFLANSEATKRDLLQTAHLVGQTIEPSNVSVIPLDADFRPTEGAAPADPAATLARLGVADRPFVLLVSTVESRKGHATAFDAWRQLIDRHGPARVPLLVCVGKKGWLSEHLYERLETDHALGAGVRMLSGVADQDLALLYRSCLFTIYPSLYEGWGLPITEALSYGKPVIAADTSSLPEAGGPFALYVPPNDPHALAAAAEHLAFDDAARTALAARIVAGFRPRRWSDIAAQIRTELSRMAAQAGAVRQPAPPLATLGAYHAVARSTATTLWPGASSGEAFRTGTGWLAPSHEASNTRPQGGELAMTLKPGPEPLRLGLLLLGGHRVDVAWRVAVRGGPAAHGTLPRGGRKWVMLTLPATLRANTLHLRLRAEPAEPDRDADEDDATVGLAGFFAYAETDVAAGMRLLEAVALGNLDDIDANRPPDEAAASEAWDQPT